MKKKTIVAMIMISVILISACSNQSLNNNQNQELTPPDIWAGIEIDEYYKFNYDTYDDFFTPQELADIVNWTKEMDMRLIDAVSRKLVIVRHTVATFDNEIEMTYLMSTDKEIIREYEPDEDECAYIPKFCEFYGNYIVDNELFAEDGTFIKEIDLIDEFHTNRLIDIDDSIILDDETYLIASTRSGVNRIYILYPDGSSCNLNFPRDKGPKPDAPIIYEDAANVPVDANEDILAVGRISEGLIGVQVVHNIGKEHYLYYFDSNNGKLLINLSHEETPYKVYELGYFKEGKAEIKIKGVDDKDYIAVINKSGDFIVEPYQINTNE